MIIDTLRNMLSTNGRTGLLAQAFTLAMLFALFAAVLSVAFALQTGSPVQAQTPTPTPTPTPPPQVTGLAQPSDNGGKHRCTGATLNWTAPTDTTLFDGYRVNYQLVDAAGNPVVDAGGNPVDVGSFVISDNTATSVFVEITSTATESRRYKISVRTYKGTDRGAATDQTVTVPSCLPAVTRLRQSSDNDGYDRCARIVVEWNDPGHTNFTGYNVAVTHPDETEPTTNLTAHNLAIQANTSAIVLVREPSPTDPQTYKIDVNPYKGDLTGTAASLTVRVPACVKPGTPSSLRLTGIDQTPLNPSSIELTWTAPSNVVVQEYILEQLRDGFTDWNTEAEQISSVPADSGYQETTPSKRFFRFVAPSMRAGDTRQYRLTAVRYVGFPIHAYPGYGYPVNPLERRLRLESIPSTPVSFKHVTAPASPWLTAETDGDGVALLTWVAPTEDGGARVTSYQLQRSTVAVENIPQDDSGWTNLSAPSSSSGEYRHTGLTAGDTWHYRMRARNSEGWSSWHYAQVTIPTGGLPEKPGLTARLDGTTVNLSWTEAPKIGTTYEGTTYARKDCNNGKSWTASDRGNFVCYYELQLQEDDGGWPTAYVLANDYRNSHRPTVLRITIDERSHEYQTLRPGSSYKFRVRAVTGLVNENKLRFGAWSTVRTVRVSTGPTIIDDRTDEEVPVRPDRPEISFTEKANNAGSDATIRWSLPEGYTGSVSGYVLEWENPTTRTWARLTTTNGSTTTYKHRNLNPSTRYAYRVAIRYGSGIGPYSRSASGITPGIAFPPDAPKGVRVTSISTTGFNVAWNRSLGDTYTPATTRYVYGLCERVMEKRTIIGSGGTPITGDAEVIRCNASQSTTGTTGRITTMVDPNDPDDTGERIFGVAAVNSRGQSDWTRVFVSVPDAATKRLTVSPASLTLTEGDYATGGSYTVTLANGGNADYQLLIDSSWDKNALVTKECNPKDCMLTSANSHRVTVTAYAMWDEDRNNGAVVFHHEIAGVVSGPSVNVTVRDTVNEPPKINGKGDGGEIAATIAENSTGSLGTYTFTDKENDIWRAGILPESELYQSLSFQGDDLMLGSPLDFENRRDKNGDGIYEIKLYARDRFSTTIVTVNVTVTDVSE